MNMQRVAETGQEKDYRKERERKELLIVVFKLKCKSIKIWKFVEIGSGCRGCISSKCQRPWGSERLNHQPKSIQGLGLGYPYIFSRDKVWSS